MTAIHLEDSTVVVVGGDTELGRLVALGFVRAGSQRIGIAGSDLDKAGETAQAVFSAASGIWAVPAAGDLASASDAERMVAELAASLGDADIVVAATPQAEMVSDVVRQSMTDRGEGVVITPGHPSIECVHGVWVCSVGDVQEAAPEQFARAILEAATKDHGDYRART